MNQIAMLIESLQNPFSTLPPKNVRNAQKLFETLIEEGNQHQQTTWAAHMTPAVESPALLGNLLAGFHNGNLLSTELYPHLSSIESQLIHWFCQLFQQNHGHFTHGGTYANLEALWQARDRKANPSNIVYASEASHYSIAKACQILGLQFQSIATDDQGEIQLDALKIACQHTVPIAIIATAGTSSCGAIDNLAACIELANNIDCWCHIDAAWGGALQLLNQTELHLKIEGADSICFDPHKALAQPKPCSILLYQNPLNSISGLDYLSSNPRKILAGSYGGELFLPLWCSLQLDKKGLIDKLKFRLEQAKLFAQMLKDNTDWQVWHSETGIICFKANVSCDLSALEKKAVFSTSKINGQNVMRAVFASHTTSAKDLFTKLEPYL